MTLHPLAWWLWALALAVMVSTTTNVLVLAITVAIVVLTVVARRPDAAWSRGLGLYFGLGAFVIAIRVVLHVVVGLKTSDVILPLPRIPLPSWAAGIELLGPVGLGGLLNAALEGLRLAVMMLCFGAANSLANPRKLLASLPHAVKDLGTAVVISLSIAPQLVVSVARVQRAQILRGETTRRGSARRVAMPVLHDTLERSISLAAAMESRGFGRRVGTESPHRKWAAWAALGGAVLSTIGLFLVLTGSSLYWPLIVGLVLDVSALRISGRAMRRTQYRPQRWGIPETVTALSGVVACAAVRVLLAQHPDAVGTPTQPLGFPSVPTLLPVFMLIAAIPAFVTPAPVSARRDRTERRTHESADTTTQPDDVRALLRGEIA